MSDKKGIVVYCASSSRVPARYLEAAHEMGSLIAAAGYPLICGGGSRGLMAEAIEGVIGAGGEAIGVLPHFMLERGWAHPSLTLSIDTPSMHARKDKMASMARAAIALPGGIGTLDELCEIMTWHQLGIFGGEVIIVNIDGFFDPLIGMFSRMQEQSFMRGDVIPATVVASPSEAMEVVQSAG